MERYHPFRRGAAECVEMMDANAMLPMLPPIKGFLSSTLIDWKGKIASEIFISGCNFRCPFCQNPKLALDDPSLPIYDHTKILLYIISKWKWIDGVVISGGEPFSAEGIMNLLELFAEHKVNVKVDTNGSFPDLIREAIKQGLISYISMDIKSDPSKYQEYLKADISGDVIMESISILMNSNIDHEFRTTVVPGIVNSNDVEKISRLIKGARSYVLQQFNPKITLSRSFSKLQPFSGPQLEELKKSAGKNVNTSLRGLEYGTK